MSDHDYNLFIHGLNVGRTYDYLTPARNSMPLTRELVGLRWNSTGTVRGDVVNMTRLHGQVLFDAQNAYDKIVADRGGSYPRYIIAHSMGQIVVANLYLSEWSKIVTVGGPMSHPLWSRWMRMMGLWRRPFPRGTFAFVNRLDPITAMQHGPWKRRCKDVPGTKTIEIGNHSEPPDGNQHHISVYLTDPAVRKALPQ